LAILGAVAIVSLFVFTLVVTFTSSPTFCNFCHEMKADIKSWEVSTHGKVTCYACHGKTNVFALLIDKPTKLKEPIAHFANNYELPINAEGKLSQNHEEFPNKVCERCHSIRKRNVTPKNGIIINHQKHIDKGFTCTACHNRVAHKTIKKYLAKDVLANNPNAYRDRSEMRYCMEHHNGKKGQGPSKCTTCHPKAFKFMPGFHKEKGFIYPVGANRGIHGQMAKKDRKACMACHHSEDEFCNKCHGMSMPHPEATWTKGPIQHKVIGKMNPKSCQKCHPGVDFCGNCHHKRTGGVSKTLPWVKVHFKVVTGTGGKQCWGNCHTPLFCANCHLKNGMKQ